jgi:hypothetical protein
MGWTVCYEWQTVHLEAWVDKKYLDRSYRCKNVTGVHCHSRRFVGWTDSVGRIVAWSVYRWTDRLGTFISKPEIWLPCKIHLCKLSNALFHLSTAKIVLPQQTLLLYPIRVLICTSSMQFKFGALLLPAFWRNLLSKHDGNSVCSQCCK